MTSAWGQTGADRRHLAPTQGRPPRVRVVGSGRADRPLRRLNWLSVNAAERPSADVSRKFYSSSRGEQQPPRPVLLGPPRINVAPIGPRPVIAAYITPCFVCRRQVDTERAGTHGWSRAERPATDARHANLNLLSSDLTCRRRHGPSRLTTDTGLDRHYLHCR